MPKRNRKRTTKGSLVAAIANALPERMVSLEQLVLDPDLQIRTSLNQAIIDEYARKMAPPERELLDEDEPPEIVDVHGESFAPIEVIATEEGELLLTDGWHRVAAARKNKVERFQARIKRGTRQDALEACLKANALHGLRRSRADKQRAVRVALLNEEFVKRSDGWVAAMCGVSTQSVHTARKKMILAGEIEFHEQLEGRDGRLYKMTPPEEAEESTPKVRESGAKVSPLIASDSLTLGVKKREDLGGASPPPPRPSEGALTGITPFANPGLGGYRNAASEYAKGRIVVTPLPDPVDLIRLLAPMASASCVAREYVTATDGTWIVWSMLELPDLARVAEDLDELVEDLAVYIDGGDG